MKIENLIINVDEKIIKKCFFRIIMNYGVFIKKNKIKNNDYIKSYIIYQI